MSDLFRFEPPTPLQTPPEEEAGELAAIENESSHFPLQGTDAFLNQPEEWYTDLYRHYSDAIKRRGREPLDKQAFIGHFFEGWSGCDNSIYGNDKKGYLLGMNISGIFAPSHFAPQSMRGGYELVKELGSSDIPSLLTITPDLTQTITKFPSWQHAEGMDQTIQHNGEPHLKQLVYNEAFQQHLPELLTRANEEGIEVSQLFGSNFDTQVFTNTIQDTRTMKNWPRAEKAFLDSLQDENLRNFLQENGARFYSTRKVVYQWNEDGEQTKQVESLPIAVLPAPQPEHAPALKEYYGYTGGVARAVALGLLHEDIRPPKPRDLDIIAIQDRTPPEYWQEEAKQLSYQLNPRDTKYGYGIPLNKLDAYFSTRDFTLNEVLYTDGELHMTAAALEALASHTVAPSTYVMSAYGLLENSNLVLKSVRLKHELELTYGNAAMESVPDWMFSMENIRDFDLALAVEKVSQQDDALAFLFFKTLIEKGLVGPNGWDVYSLTELARKVRENLMGSFEYTRQDWNTVSLNDLFSFTPEQWRTFDQGLLSENDRGISREMDRYYWMHAELAKQVPMSPELRDEIKNWFE